MSDAKWTPDQQKAIDARGSNILVAAAAGSGKTATLVERVIRRLTDPAAPIDVDQLLVVTFTEAAATEMRERIAAALTKQLVEHPEDTRLQRQLTLLGRAAISTLHSFCLGLIRQYFYRLGIDPAVSVLGEQEALLLRQEVLDELFAERYEEEPDGPFYQLVERYGGGRDDSGLRDLVLTIYDYTQSLVWPDGWLAEAVGRFTVSQDATVEQLPWWPPLRRQVELELAGAVTSLSEATRIAMLPAGPAPYVDTLLRETAAVRAAAAGAETWEGLAATVQVITFERAPAVKAGTCDDVLKEQVTELRNKAKKAVATIQETYFSRPAAEWLADLRSIAPHLQTLAELVQQFGAAFRAAKAEQSAIDFNDLERFALQLLTDQTADAGTLRPTEVAQELRTRYAEILVDEYQDINAVQDAILSMVAQDGEAAPSNRFMVGDVKQSIYRFRHANPTLFLAKYRAYPPYGELAPGGRRIVLGANFRSRQGVVDAVNFIFRQIMAASVAEIDYDQDAELVCRAGYPEVEGWREPPVELHLLDRKAPEPGEGEEESSPEEQELADLSSLEKEARLVARRIKELVENRIPVFDKASGGYRPVRYRDIVVLLRATTGRANVFVETLAAQDIPAYAQLATGYFAATEIEVMLAFLALLDNPRQDIPLAAVLRSPIVGLSAADLARVRLASKGSLMDAVYAASRLYDETGLADVLRQFIERLNGWRTAVRRRPLSEVLWQVYEQTGYLTYVQGMPGGAQRHANLLALYDRARQFDQFARQGLFRFLRFIDGLKAEEADMGAAPAIGEAEDVVRIMSIHKSKGLEFPVTFVADLGKALNRLDLTGDMLLQRDYGFGPNLVDPELRVKYPTLAWHAVRQAIRMEALAEEMRILYVALTRARERLILVGSVKDLPKCCKAWAMSAGAAGWALPDPTLAAAKTYLDWLCPSLVRHVGGSPLLVAAEQATTAAGSSAPEVARDPSRWDVRLWDTEAQLLLASAPAEPTEAEPLDWEAIGAMRPIVHTPASDASEALKARFAWEYEFEPVVQRFGKLTVTELKGHFDPDAAEPAPALPGALPPDDEPDEQPDEAPDQEPDGEPTRPRVSLSSRPRFLQQGKSALTPTELGTLMHLVLQHLDLRRPLDQADVAAQVEALAEQEVLAPAHAKAIDVKAIARFFASPLGRRIKAEPERVQREVSFTLALPAAEVYPELDRRLTAGERVIVQGMIDLLLETEDGFVLLDYKTDKREPEEGARQYRTQVSLYRRAVEEILGKPVKEAYLHFLVSGNSVLI